MILHLDLPSYVTGNILFLGNEKKKGKISLGELGFAACGAARHQECTLFCLRAMIHPAGMESEALGIEKWLRASKH